MDNEPLYNETDRLINDDTEIPVNAYNIDDNTDIEQIYNNDNSTDEKNDIEQAKSSLSVSFKEQVEKNYFCSNGLLVSKLQSIAPEISCSESTENIIGVFWGAFVFFVGVIFVVAQYTTPLKTYTFASTYWVLFAFMVISIIGMSICIRHHNNETFIIEREENFEDEEKQDGDINKYLICAIYIFAIGNFLLDLFSIITVFHCGIGQTTSSQKHEYAIKFIFHATRITYTALQLIFLQIFIFAKVQRTFQLYFKLLIIHIIATNFNIWFTYLCQETGIMNSGSKLHSTGEYSLSCTDNKNDGAFKTAANMNEILQPFILEFSLLAASICYSIYPLKDSSGKERDRRRKYNYGAIDTVTRDNSKRFKSDPGILFGIFVALLLILSSWTLNDDTRYVHNLRFSYSMQIIVHSLIIIFTIVILRELKTFHAKEPDRKYRIDDYLLLLTGLGGFLPFFFAVVFSISKQKDYSKVPSLNATSKALNQHEQELRAVLGVLSIVNTIAVLVQTFFLLSANSFKRVAFAGRRKDSSIDYAECELNYKKLRSSARITQMLGFLLILNLALWITDSFLELRGDLERTYGISLAYWGAKAWLFITKLLYPILIYYRFHAIALIAQIWSHFQVNKKVYR